MEEDKVEIEFAVRNQIPSPNIFKSSFARSFVVNWRNTKAIDTEFIHINSNIDEDLDLKENVSVDGENNNYLSFMAVDNLPKRCGSNINNLTEKKQSLNDAEQQELNSLRKQCRSLTEENRRLDRALQLHQTSNVQAIDTILLQTQIDTLQWQLKQTEANCQMYQSLMKQVVHFLERAQISLNNLYADGNISKNITQNNYNRSDYNEEQPIDSSLVTSPNSVSRFSSAKSITPVSPGGSRSCACSFTWSMMKRNKCDQCSLFDANLSYPIQGHSNESKYEYCGRKHGNDSTGMKVTNNHIPPEKLSQEAFRLLRTVESLLTMREPHLTMVSSSISSFTSTSLSSSISTSTSLSPSSSFIISSPTSIAISNNNTLNFPTERNISLRSEIMDSTRLHNTSYDKNYIFNDSRVDIENFPIFNKLSSGVYPLISASSCSGNTSSSSRSSSSSISSRGTPSSVHSTKPDLVNLNTTIINPEIEDFTKNETTAAAVAAATSLPNQNLETTELMNSQNSQFIEESIKCANSAEDESGFSSINSFQDVGLPTSTPLSFIKDDYDRDIGLPKISFDNINHRRWSSSSTEIQTLFKKYNKDFLSYRSNADSFSVWV